MAHYYMTDSATLDRVRVLRARLDGATGAYERATLQRRIDRLMGYAASPAPIPTPEPAPQLAAHDASMAAVPGAFEAAPGFWEVRS